MSFYSQTLKIHPASPQARGYIESFEDAKGTKPVSVGKHRYPWNQLKIGECFIEAFDKNTQKKLQVCANFQKHYSGKVFIVIKHEDLQVYEVARVA